MYTIDALLNEFTFIPLFCIDSSILDSLFYYLSLCQHLEIKKYLLEVCGLNSLHGIEH